MSSRRKIKKERLMSKVEGSSKTKMMMGKKRVRYIIKTKHYYIDEFKTYRRVMFAFGKTIKYTLWLSFSLFWYHMYLLKKTEKPENGFLAN